MLGCLLYLTAHHSGVATPPSAPLPETERPRKVALSRKPPAAFNVSRWHQDQDEQIRIPREIIGSSIVNVHLSTDHVHHHAPVISPQTPATRSLTSRLCDWGRSTTASCRAVAGLFETAGKHWQSTQSLESDRPHRVFEPEDQNGTVQRCLN